MIELDNDLQSRQNARELVRNAKKAQAILATFSQQQIDAIVKNVAQEAAHHAEALAKMAAEETGFGNWQDKVLKNRFASLRVYDAIKDMKTVGIIHDDPVKKVMDVGVPLGVICALVPSTNPTSTVIYKALIALKAGNAIIFSPHPGARQCSWKAIEIVKRAAEAAGRAGRQRRRHHPVNARSHLRTDAQQRRVADPRHRRRRHGARGLRLRHPDHQRRPG